MSVFFGFDFLPTTVSQHINHPPTRSNSIKDIVMFYGQESNTVNLPDDLFIDSDGDDLEYSTTVCSNSINIGTYIKKDNNTNVLYLINKMLSVGDWQFLIIATDPYNQSCSYSVNVTVESCASKDWTLCNSSIQKDWLAWSDGYILEEITGLWLATDEYLSSNFSNFFVIFGFSTFLLILLPIFFYKLYGKIVLYPVMYIQILIAVVFANEDVSNNVKNYFKWMQIYKLDLGVLNKITMLNKTKLWIHSNNISFVNVQIYWSGFIVNFIFPLLICAFIFILWRICILIRTKSENLQISHFIDCIVSSFFSKSLMWWCFNKLFFVFPAWWIAMDLINVSNNFLIAFSSIIVVLLMIIAIIYSKFEWFKSHIFASEEKKYHIKFEFLHIARNIIVIILFLLNSSNQSDIIKIAFWSIQLSIMTYTLVSKNKIGI